MGQMCLRGLANSYAKLRLPGGFQFDWLVLCKFPTCSEVRGWGCCFSLQVFRTVPYSLFFRSVWRWHKPLLGGFRKGRHSGCHGEMKATFSHQQGNAENAIRWPFLSRTFYPMYFQHPEPWAAQPRWSRVPLGPLTGCEWRGASRSRRGPWTARTPPRGGISAAPGQNGKSFFSLGARSCHFSN